MAVPSSALQKLVSGDTLGSGSCLRAYLLPYRECTVGRCTLHHNLFVNAETRNPQAGNGDIDGFTPATDTTLDMRNNLVCGWGPGYGTSIRDGARANVVNNYCAALGGDKRDALNVEQAQAFVQGNVSADRLAFDLNDASTAPSPFPAPSVTTSSAEAAAREMLESVGAKPRSKRDSEALGMVALPIEGVGE